jgi:FkbM family methyltransferase
VLRRWIERFSRGIVLRRRLPAELGGGELFVSPDSALKLWHPDLRSVDEGLLRLAAELVGPGEVVWDVGANVGLFAFAAAHAAGPQGRVLAVEADPWLAGLLRRSAQARSAGSAPVEILPAAVMDRQGTVELCVSARGRAGNHLRAVRGSSQTGGVRQVQEIESVTLDGLLDSFPPPGLVKIDVEGAEALCLRGGEKLLREVRPRLLVEVAEPNADEIGARLRAEGYSIFDARTPKRIPLERPPWDTLAVPLAGSGK